MNNIRPLFNGLRGPVSFSFNQVSTWVYGSRCPTIPAQLFVHFVNGTSDVSTQEEADRVLSWLVRQAAGSELG